MDWKNQLTKTPFLVFFIFLIAIGVGTAYAGVGLPTITLAGIVETVDYMFVGGDLEVGGAIPHQLLVWFEKAHSERDFHEAPRSIIPKMV